MRYGFDYITSGSYAGDWSELYFPVDTTVTLTTTKGDSVTTTFTEGTSIVGTYVGINISSGGIIAYKRSDTEKILLQDPAITALLAQAATDGYTAASGSTLTALDTYVKGLKADGIWDKLDLLYVFATNGDSDFATYNLKDPANFQATKVNAPTFTSLEGFTGDGASAYLDTNWNPNTNGVNYQLSDASLGYYVRSFGDVGVAMAMRTSSNNNSTGITRRNGQPNDFVSGINSNSGYDISSLGRPVLTGMHMASRANSADYDVFENGVKVLDITTAEDASLTGENMYILTSNSGSSTPAAFSSDQLSIAFAGADLSAEASDFYTRTQNYMTALGKEV